jgi:CRP-like cAMP-binding protein
MNGKALRLVLREGHSPLAELADDVLDRLAGAAVAKTLSKGEMLFNEGDPARWAYLLISGGVRLVRTDHHGREQVLHSVRRGESFAEAAFFGEGTYPATAVASDPSRVLGFSRERMLAVIAEHPEAALSIIASLSRWLRRLAGAVEGLALKSADARLAEYLLTLAGGVPAADSAVVLPTSKTELAARLGVAPETLSRALKRMTDEGLLAVDGRRITLRLPGELASLADS